jgi:hypothetical protein
MAQMAVEVHVKTPTSTIAVATMPSILMAMLRPLSLVKSGQPCRQLAGDLIVLLDGVSSDSQVNVQGVLGHLGRLFYAMAVYFQMVVAKSEHLATL